MISARYVPAICVLFLIALVPTLIHSYGTDVAADGLSTTAIGSSLVGYQSSASGRSPNWGLNRFGSDDWVERNYSSGVDDVRLTVIRSADLKALYHHPELAVAYGPRFGSSFEGHQVTRLAAAPGIPLHVLRPSAGETALGLYVLHYDGEFIDDPIWFQLRTAGKLLVTGRKRMTLFFAHDLNAPRDANLDTLPATKLLLTAIEQFLAPRPE
jgi:hypothetical protein